jgi:hypothetical protein
MIREILTGLMADTRRGAQIVPPPVLAMRDAVAWESWKQTHYALDDASAGPLMKVRLEQNLAAVADFRDVVSIAEGGQELGNSSTVEQRTLTPLI